ncbi:BTAD domain-containing putative transcriptional regulator [Plantactinospora sp. KBS50]|uniref:AfsR/SARP family transcriptional regulator n=1 Tax=Plantactinospora sp. KBS50 TaxID=2024580 RepID=UPI000BAAEE9A|nr:BTAD domain-containing putative transcriptional regulator [Plantactinospora sp. KBS50]ASW55984.1 hypothetical protein CIK06_20110 [Plantactinospora sp. KBS50]
MLGPVGLVGAAGPVPLSEPVRRLLGLLALRANQPVPQAELAGVPDPATPRSAAALDGPVAELTAALHLAGLPATVLARREGYLLRVSARLVDARRFDRLLVRARVRMSGGDLPGAARLFAAALRLWRPDPDAPEPPLGGVPPGCPPWAAVEASRLVQSRIAAVEDRWECELRLVATAYQAAGAPVVDPSVIEDGMAATARAAEARVALTAALRRHPLRARLWELLLVAAFLGHGRKAAAEMAEVAERTFRDQVGIGAGERLHRLARAAQRGDLAETWAARPDDGRAVRPISGPAGPVPGARPGPPGPRPVPSRLPVPMTPLLGRDGLLGEVERLLAVRRLVTLTGPGGSGKTRLAIAVARRVSAAAWFVDLSAVEDPGRVAETVAATLGVRLGLDHGGPADALGEAIGDADAVLVLDNCENLVTGCAALLRRLLPQCPRLRVLATSRAALRVAGERLVPVPPLAAPTPGTGYTLADLVLHPATRLFLERARARSGQPVAPDSADDVVRLCAELDGLPLAIELAAAWTPLLSVAEIASRTAVDPHLLRSPDPTAPSRHRTVAAAVETSVSQLDDEARTLFEWLAVFGGGFDTETAGQIRGPAGVAALTALADASLVAAVDEGELIQAGGAGGRDRAAGGPPERPAPLGPLARLPEDHPPRQARYRMLVPIRRHALHRLARSGAEEVARRAHARYVVALAERADDRLRGPAQQCWLYRLRAEEANLRWAMRWLAGADTGGEHGDLRLATALAMYCRLEGHYRDGLDWLSAALDRHPDAPAPLRARAGAGAAMLAMLLCDYPVAVRHAERARAACRSVDDRRTEARLELILGSVARDRARYADSAAHLAAATALLADCGDEWGEAQAVQLRGVTAWLSGDLDRADSRLRASLRRFERLGDTEAEATALMNLGAVALYRGDPDRAASLLDAALHRYAAIGFTEGVGWAHNLRGLVDLGARRTARARAHLLVSVAAHRSIGDRWRMASVLEALAEVARLDRDRIRAARLLGAAARIRDEIGAPVPACERAATAATGAALLAELGAVFAVAVREGRRSPLDALLAGGGAIRPSRPSAPAEPPAASAAAPRSA